MKLLFNHLEQFCDGNGAPHSGGLLYTYVAGSSTKLVTYQDANGSVPHANPIVLDSAGRLPSGVYGTGQYKIVFSPSTDTDPPTSPIWTLDNVEPINEFSATVDQWGAAFAATYVSGTQFTLTGDQTSAFHAGRRIKVTDAGGTKTGVITASSFGASTTVTVSLDSGTLSSPVSSVSLSLLSASDHALPTGPIVTPAQLTASQNNWSPSGIATARVVRFSTDASRDITGILAGSDGRRVIFHNVGSNPGVLKDESGSSTAANRLALDADITLLTDQACELIYDGTSARWRLFAIGKNAATITGTETLTNKTFVAPALGTPASGVLTNCTGLPTGGLVDAAVTEAKLGAAAVAQAKLKSTTGEVSTSSGTPTNLTLPGGEYGFYPQLRVTGANGTAALAAAITSTSYATLIALSNDAGGGETTRAQQRYIQASPPYDLGNGDIPIFAFVLVDSLGKIVGTYVAEDPPWAHNGPTNITPDFYDAQGRGWQYRRPRVNLATLRNPAARDAELARLNAAPQLVEVTQAVKQTDMPLIPHPFIFGNDLTGKTVVLLDPVGPMAARLHALHRAGESVSEILHADYLSIDNTPQVRQAPPGVMPVAVSWK